MAVPLVSHAQLNCVIFQLISPVKFVNLQRRNVKDCTYSVDWLFITILDLMGCIPENAYLLDFLAHEAKVNSQWAEKAS
jgi:hypothetical protein